MPYKYSYTHLLIPRELDKRVKLSLEEREQIKFWYGRISQRKLAAKYGVSRRLVIFIGDPEKYEKNLANRKLNGGSKAYYKKEKHTVAMRKHRKSKQELYLKNELEEQI